MERMRFVVSDLDGTMRPQYKNFSEAVKKLLVALKESGFSIVIATGQQYKTVNNLFLENGLAVSPDYVIADQGTVIYNNGEDKITESFYLQPSDVAPIFYEFLRLGGTEKFARICTPETTIAFECDEAREFFKKPSRGKVTFVNNLGYIIENTQYTKVMLMSTREIVDELVQYSMNRDASLNSVNTGETGYGNCHFHRLEITRVNKGGALKELLSMIGKFPIDLICLGDELPDGALAQVASEVNQYPGSTAHFGLINDGTLGSKQLREYVEKIVDPQRLIVAPSVQENGWNIAIEEWLKRINQ